MSVISRPYDIETFMWATRRSALKLEMLGMKTRGGSLRPKLAVELGLKPRDTYDTFINKITALIEERNTNRPT